MNSAHHCILCGKVRPIIFIFVYLAPFFTILLVTRLEFRILLLVFLLFILLPIPVLSGFCQASLYRRFSGSIVGKTGSQISVYNVQKTPFGELDFREVDVSAAYSKEPAPMGIADYGIGPNGPYEYATNDSVGIVALNSLSTRNSTGSADMSFQLNVNLVFTSNDVPYVYWIQDAADVDTSSRVISFADNVWNSSAPSANMTASGIKGNGEVATSKAGSYYGYTVGHKLRGNNIALTYPSIIMFNVTSGITSSGEPTVSFAYDDGYGLITYDVVTFSIAHELTSLKGFEVNGFSYNPRGLFYDSELILGGSGYGSKTTDLQSDVQLQLEYWNGHNYELVANAYDFGSDTAEGIGNVLSQFYYYPESGTMLAEIRQGAGQLGELYDEAQIAIINITSPLTSGLLCVTNTTNPTATARQYPFVNGEVTVTIYPGNYTLRLYQGGKLYDQGNFTVNAGQERSLHTPLSGRQSPPTSLISTPSGLMSYVNEINDFLRQITKPLGNAINGTVGNIVPSFIISFLFVDQPIFLAVLVLMIIIAVVTVVIYGKRARGSRAVPIQ